MPNIESIIDVRGKTKDKALQELEYRLNCIAEEEALWLIDFYERAELCQSIVERNLFYRTFIIDKSECRLLICKR